MVYFDDKEEKKIADLRQKEEEELIDLVAQQYGVASIDLTQVSIEPDALKLIPEKSAQEAGVAAFNLIGQKLKVAVLSPKHAGTEEILAGLSKKYNVEIYLTSKASLARAYSYYKDIASATRAKEGVLEIAQNTLEGLVEKIKTPTDVAKILEEEAHGKEGYTISKMLEVMLAGAISSGASDIHIEPEEGEVRLRLRLDGVLRDVAKFNHATYKLLVSRIKLLSGIKLTAKDASDGRFSIKLHDTELEIRSSVVPGAYGEAIVMRVLNPKDIGLSLEELGMSLKLREIIGKYISKTKGIILTTGPTGSGKTTTLYAFLRSVHVPGIKIITIENPIEYHLAGITQTQTDEGKNYGFLEGLRAALRQDPDVIMVGEIRDLETAKTAIDAALTGHIVFSTLHTNSAAGAIPRLIDLGVNEKIISSALTVSLAQRLARKLCQDCQKKYVPSEKEFLIIKNVLEQMKEAGKEEYLKEINFNEKSELAGAGGCSRCGETGYKGRIGVFEAIIMDEAIENALEKHPSEREIEKLAKPQKIPSLREDGILKVLAGQTSFEELNRVVDLF